MGPRTEQQPADEEWVDPLHDELVACGNEYLKNGLFFSAIEVFQAAGVAPPKDKLVTCGNNFLEKGWFSSAVEAFQAAGVAPPKDKLVACGNKCLENGWFFEAVEAFQAAGDKDKLVACGDTWLEDGWCNEALKAFQAAGDMGKDKLAACGNDFEKAAFEALPDFFKVWINDMEDAADMSFNELVAVATRAADLVETWNCEQLYRAFDSLLDHQPRYRRTLELALAAKEF